jgi:hypothetical protein
MRAECPAFAWLGGFDNRAAIQLLAPGGKMIHAPLCIFPSRFSIETIQGRVMMTLAPGRGGQTKYFLYGAPKNHAHYGLSIFCMDKHR